MKKNFIKKSLLILISIILANCAKYKDNPVGSDFYKKDYMGEEKCSVFYASKSDTFFKADVTTGYSSCLNIGTINNIQSKFLLKFANLSDTFKVDSAGVLLRLKDAYGYTGGDIITSSIYLVSKDWNEWELMPKDFDNSFQGEFIKEILISSDQDSIYFTLPDTLVQTWIDTTTASENYGLLFTSTDAPFMASLYSVNADSNRPIIKCYTHTDSTDLELIRYGLNDVYLAEQENEADSDFLYLANSISLRSLIYFDVSSIPENATINKANLIIHSDITYTFPDTLKNFVCSIYNITDSTWSIPSIPVDTLSSAFFTLTKDSSTAAISKASTAKITQYVQQWTAGINDNNGLMFVGSNENNDLRYARLFSSSNSDSVKKPRLQIFYTIPSQSKL